jgi:small subunit ribosomal protein S29
VAVDEYNYLFRPTIYPSFRYATDNSLNSRVPPYHLALCRYFVNFDGHKIKNGFKLTASSNTRF